MKSSRVRDGERGLVGERLEDRELGVVERAHLWPQDVDVADPLGLAEQCNGGVAPGVRERLGEFGGDDVEIVECQSGVAPRGVRVDVAVVGGELLADRHVAADAHLRCGDPENRSVLQQDAAVGCVAQAGGFRHDCLEHGRQVAGVGADQSQRLGGGGLEFQRLGQVVVAFLDLARRRALSTAIAAWSANACSSATSGSVNPPDSARVKLSTPITCAMTQQWGSEMVLGSPLLRRAESGNRSGVMSSQFRMWTIWAVQNASLAGFGVDASDREHAPHLLGSRPLEPTARASVAVADEERCGRPAAQPVCVTCDRLEHRLEVVAGRAHSVQDVGHRGLAFEGGVEFVEQVRRSRWRVMPARRRTPTPSARHRRKAATSWRYMCRLPTGAPSSVSLAAA